MNQNENFYSLEAELLEQARLLGKGAEREEKLLSQVEVLKRENLRLESSKKGLENKVQNLKTMVDSQIDEISTLVNDLKHILEVNN